MGKTYVVDVDDEFDDSILAGGWSFEDMEADQELSTLFNDLHTRGKGKKGGRKSEHYGDPIHRSLPRDWMDFDFGDDSSEATWG